MGRHVPQLVAESGEVISARVVGTFTGSTPPADVTRRATEAHDEAQDALSREGASGRRHTLVELR